MKHLFLTFFIVVIATVGSLRAQGNEALLEQVKQNPVLSWGGCDIVQMSGTEYLVAVSSVEVGTKKLPQLRTIAAAKAKRDLLLMIKGSTITSSTEMTTTEEVVVVNGKSTVSTVESYFEKIRESADGFVQGMVPLGLWYSDDRSLFFYALYKSIN